MTQNELKDANSSQNSEQNTQITPQAKPEMDIDNSADSTPEEQATGTESDIKARYEGVIAEIRAEKSDIEEKYKTYLIKDELKKLELNTELVYLVMKGRGDIDKISYKNDKIEGLEDIIAKYKQDENISELFIAKSYKNDITQKTLRTRAINSIGSNNYQKEKDKICHDWCHKN